MKIAVVHRSLGITGGGERVCLSLLAALDRTGHDVALRCVDPPHGVRFAGGELYPAHPWSPCDAACRASHAALRRVRLDLAAERGGGDAPPGRGGLFDAGPGTDMLVVTDGGFALDRTDAPRVVLYCNAVLREEGRIDHLRKSRSPRAHLRYYLAKRADRRVLRLARDDRVLLVPNSADTREVVGRAVGREPGPVVHPPVDLRRYSALRRRAKEDAVATVARYAPEKNLAGAARIMSRAGAGRWEVVGSAVHRYQLDYHRMVAGMVSGTGARLRLNEGPGAVDDALGRARVYLHASKETFGIAVAEAVAAGCVPVVPDNSAHPETVPFAELRYGTEEEAAGIVREALGGRYDALLPALREHVQRFSEEAFQGHARDNRGAGVVAPLPPAWACPEICPTSRTAFLCTARAARRWCSRAMRPAGRPSSCRRPSSRTSCARTTRRGPHWSAQSSGSRPPGGPSGSGSSSGGGSGGAPARMRPSRPHAASTARTCSTTCCLSR